MAGNAELATFLITRRNQIEGVMATRLGPAAPGPGAPESEVLRRFRSYAAAALRFGEAAQPALDGLRSNERRTAALLDAWAASAAEVAGDSGDALQTALDPLLRQFRTSLKTTATGRRSKGAPRSRRRAVMAAIDRVADAFLALDQDANIVDANPAAGALLGVPRDTLLGIDGLSFVPEAQHGAWWTAIDAVAEGSDQRFESRLRDVDGAEIAVDCSATRFATRSKTLALVVARPSRRDA